MTQDIVDKALADPDNPFWTTGIIPHHEDVAPRPASGGMITYVDARGKSVDCDAWRTESEAIDIAIDGSCDPHCISGLARASWAVVFFSSVTGKFDAALSGPVWDSLPLTSQAGEQVAMAVVHEVLTHSAHTHADCMAVVNCENQPQYRQRRPGKMCAGLRRAALREQGTHYIDYVSHTPAHITLAGI